MSLAEYTLFAFSSLFVIIDPIATVPVFLAMTADDSVAKRVRMARFACLVAAGVLLTFAFLGRWIFQLLGITMAAFDTLKVYAGTANLSFNVYGTEIA